MTTRTRDVLIGAAAGAVAMGTVTAAFLWFRRKKNEGTDDEVWAMLQQISTQP